MSKEIKNLILIYVLPIMVLSAILGAIHPLAAQVVLFMLLGASAISIGMAFLIEYVEKKM
jgi:hypothetical protein